MTGLFGQAITDADSVEVVAIERLEDAVLVVEQKPAGSAWPGRQQPERQ